MDSINRVIKAKGSPGQEISFASDSVFGSVGFGLCQVSAGASNADYRAFSGSAKLEANVSIQDATGNTAVTQFIPSLTPFTTRRNGIELVCLKHNFDFPFALTQTSLAAVIIRFPNYFVDSRTNATLNQSRSETVLLISSWESSPNQLSLAPGFELERGRVNQVEMNVFMDRVITYGVDGSVESYEVKSQAQSPFLGFSSGIPPFDLDVRFTFVNTLQSYTRTVVRKFVSYTGQDAVASIFAYISLSAALLRLLFPVLPHGPRSRFFFFGCSKPSSEGLKPTNDQADSFEMKATSV